MFMMQAIAKGKAQERSRSCCALPSIGRAVGLTFATLRNMLEHNKQKGRSRETEAPGWVGNLLPAQFLRNPNHLSDRRMSLNCS